MSYRQVQILLFASAKGGVGKSTLAVAAGMALAAEGHRPYVLDADFTGSSLGDGLPLRAPRLPRVQSRSSLDLTQSALGLLDRDETREARRERARWDPDAPFALPYLNDAMWHVPSSLDSECRLDAMAWHHPRLPGVRFLPSSPLRHDVEHMLPWLYRTSSERKPWQQRLASLLQLATHQLPELTHILVDLPPGIFGLATAAMDAAMELLQRTPFPEHARYKSTIYLVFTPDHNDFAVALDRLPVLRRRLQSAEVVAVVNDLTEGINSVRQRARTQLEEGPFVGHHRSLHGIDRMTSTLGRLFRGGEVELPDLERRMILRELELGAS